MSNPTVLPDPFVHPRVTGPLVVAVFVHLAVLGAVFHMRSDDRIYEPDTPAVAVPVSLSLSYSLSSDSKPPEAASSERQPDSRMTSARSSSAGLADAPPAAHHVPQQTAQPAPQPASQSMPDAPGASARVETAASGPTERSPTFVQPDSGSPDKFRDAAAQSASGRSGSLAPEKTSMRSADASVVSAPRLDADYLSNPVPEYPAVSRRLGEQGTVILNVLVSAEGHVLQARTHRSSGYSRLDTAALKAVANWRFVPAQRAGVNEQASVLVPVLFNLRQG